MSEPLGKTMRGRWAEEIAARWLESTGRNVLARNVRLGPLEIDIVAAEGKIVLVVEVRFRSPGARSIAIASVGPKKRAHLLRAGERLWRRRFKNDSRFERLRYDLIAIEPTAERLLLFHVPAAFVGTARV